MLFALAELELMALASPSQRLPTNSVLGSPGFDLPSGNTIMDKRTQWNMKSVLGGFRKSTESYQGASQESDGGESLLSGEKPSDTIHGQVTLPSKRHTRSRAQWIRYAFLVLSLTLYSFLLIALVSRKCSDAQLWQAGGTVV